MSTRFLNIPVDFERLPEFRMLCEALARRQVRGGEADRDVGAPSNKREADKDVGAPSLTREQIEGIATRLWMRHWVEMAYQAERTNQPGLLTKDGAALFASSVGALFGDDLSPLDLLVESKCVELLANGETLCSRFAELNAHLAGDYKKKEDVGAANSAIVRQQRQIERDAIAQGNLLPLFLFKRKDGTEISEPARNRCMVLIMNLDNALGNKGRRSTHYSDGMIADACAAVEAHTDAEELKRFYFWLANNREKALVPKTAEQILAEFEKFWDVSKA